MSTELIISVTLHCTHGEIEIFLEPYPLSNQLKNFPNITNFRSGQLKPIARNQAADMTTLFTITLAL